MDQETRQRESPALVVPLLGDPEAVSVDELDEHLMLLEAARTRLDVEWTEALASFDARKCHRVFDYPSTVAYLKDRMQMAAQRANRYLHMARTARRFRATFESWRHNLISTDQATELFRTAEKLPDEYAENEEGLLETCGDTPAETKRALDYWSSEIAHSHADTETQLRQRRLDYSRKSNGMIQGSFSLTTLTGEAFIASLESLITPPDDERTTTQRRHDALGDLALGHLERAETGLQGGEKPHINVHVDTDALIGDPGGLHETESGNVLDIDTIRQISCDSSITRILFEPQSEIIDVGRKTRVIPAALRKAVIARDRHCTHPGCDRDPTWCDVHHIIHWADGGETVLENLTLLCRYHHTLIHLMEHVGAKRPA